MTNQKVQFDGRFYIGQNNSADWNQPNKEADDYIYNKPEIAQGDWFETDESSAAYIKNKPNLDAIAQDLRDAFANMQISGGEQADWLEDDDDSPAFIQNKPKLQSDWIEEDLASSTYIKNKPIFKLEGDILYIELPTVEEGSEKI